MLPEELGICKELLLKKRQEAIECMPEMDCHEPVFVGMDMADHATDVMSKSTNSQLASRASRLCQLINEALERIKKKTYGICVSCEEPISFKRLETVPLSKHCMKCKNKRD